MNVNSMNSLTIKTLLESDEFLSSVPLRLPSEVAPTSLNDDDDGGLWGAAAAADDVSLRIRNAVRLSLLLVKAYKNGYDLRQCATLTTNDFVVALRLPSTLSSSSFCIPDNEDPFSSTTIEECEGEERPSAPIVMIATSDEFHAATAKIKSGENDGDNCDRGRPWIVLDVVVRYLDARFPSENVTPAWLARSLGELLLAAFSLNGALANPDAKSEATTETEGGGCSSTTSTDGEQPTTDDSEEGEGGRRRRAPGARRKTTAFRTLIDSDDAPPASVCRLLGDLMDATDDGVDKKEGRCKTPSFDDVIDDLERMVDLPDIFLRDPGSGFRGGKLLFGQRCHGRETELGMLLEVMTVPTEEEGGEGGLEVVFVSGIAGSGKSHLVSAVGNFVTSLGFIVSRAKFERGLEYKSREILSGFVDELISKIVKLKEHGNDADVVYALGVVQAISKALDADSLSALAAFVPSIGSLIPEVAKKEHLNRSLSLVFLLSKLLCALLSQGRKILIVFDDLQWADHSTLGLLNDVLAYINEFPEKRQHLVFIGMYRDTELSDELKMFTTPSFGANVTDVTLTTLSLDDVTSMLMSELRLPKRLVSELADVVHRRTHGHALFVVRLLDSLVSSSMITYSPMMRRFHWNRDKVCNLKTEDDVASLIVSNLTSLPVGELQCLRLISCFGMQVQSSLLDLLENKLAYLRLHGGLETYFRSLADQGIVEIASSCIAFTHDLIQEQVYKGIPTKERQQLHCDIGLLIGTMTSLDMQNNSVDDAINKLNLSDMADKRESETLLSSLAASQINMAGPDFFSETGKELRCRFAGWNLSAGHDAMKTSLFTAALYYYENGIVFLGNDLIWSEDPTYQLCLELHEGAASASWALAKSSLVSKYANNVIDNAKFDDSLVAEYLLICSLTLMEQYSEAVARGLSLLRQLKFDIPEKPTPMLVMQALEQTEREAFLYNLTQLADHHREVDSKTSNVSKLVDAIATACYQMASPFLPLVACETVRYSLQNGICAESASAFIIVAYFQVYVKKSFESGRRWANFAEKVLKKTRAESPATVRARMFIAGWVNFWYVPLQESVNDLQVSENMSFKFGNSESQCGALINRMRFLFCKGEHLSLISHALSSSIQSTARFHMLYAKHCALEKEMIDSLTGDESSNPWAIFDGKMNRRYLLLDAQINMHYQILEALYLQNFFVSFWLANYEEAAKASDIILSFPSARMPKIRLPFHICYRGIVAYHLYREGRGETWLKEGNDICDQVGIWANNSKSIFENKLILLQAEQYASDCDVHAAKDSYVRAIQVARDNGYIHEQGLAYECMGKYLMSIIEVEEANRYFMSAHNCYKQWGAMAVAKKLWKNENLNSSIPSIGNRTTNKHHRGE